MYEDFQFIELCVKGDYGIDKITTVMVRIGTVRDLRV